MSLDNVLYVDSWIPYNDTLLESRLVLTYPKNQIFTLQLLTRVLESDVYNRYPLAEKFQIENLQDIDWKQNLIVVDRDSNLVVAPEPVKDLVWLDRRLHYREAAKNIFGPFHILPNIMQIFKFQWLWVGCILLTYMIALYVVEKRKQYRLVFSRNQVR